MSGNTNTDRFGGGSDIPVDDNESYAVSGRIMLITIVVLFFVVILAFILHLYARWLLLRSRSLRSRNGGGSRNRRRRQLVFYVDQNTPAAATRGLDLRVLKSLPVFTFSVESHPDSALECAVCLSEFEENESGRVLPKCKHSFHLDCIDMWFHSHSTCPLCRTPVEGPVPASQNPGDVVLTVNEPLGGESGSNRGSDLCPTCQHDEQQAGTSAVGKLSIEVPRRNTEGFVSESGGCDSGPSQPYKSPMTRMLSLKRMLSRDRRGSGSINVSESEIERGGDEETRRTQG